MPEITMYSTKTCPFCIRAEQILLRRGVVLINKIDVDVDPARRDEMVVRTGRRTVPQIFIGKRFVGGHDDLMKLDDRGQLAPLLAE